MPKMPVLMLLSYTIKTVMHLKSCQQVMIQIFLYLPYLSARHREVSSCLTTIIQEVNRIAIYILIIVLSNFFFFSSNLYPLNPEFFLILNDDFPFNINTHLIIPFCIVIGMCFVIMVSIIGR